MPSRARVAAVGSRAGHVARVSGQRMSMPSMPMTCRAGSWGMKNRGRIAIPSWWRTKSAPVARSGTSMMMLRGTFAVAKARSTTSRLPYPGGKSTNGSPASSSILAVGLPARRWVAGTTSSRGAAASSLSVIPGAAGPGGETKAKSRRPVFTASILARSGRLGDPQSRRGTGKAPLLRYRDEASEVPEFHHLTHLLGGQRGELAQVLLVLDRDPADDPATGPPAEELPVAADARTFRYRHSL